MKSTISILCAVLFLLSFFSFLQAQTLLAEKNQKLEEIGKLLEKAMIDGDYKTILEYYTDDVIIMPGLNPAIKGISALKNAYEKNKRKGIKYHSFTANAKKRWQCGNEIFSMGTFGMAVSSKETSQPKAYYGSYFQIWQEYEDGSFKIKYNIWNLDFNPFEHTD
jgi:ketosteroid isomerase-like protein